MEAREWAIIGHGFAGWHAMSADGKVRSSGGDLVDRPWWAGGVQEGYLTHAIEGCFVYDASESEYGDFAKLVIGGPMYDPSLPANTISRPFGEVSDDKPRALDTVSLDIYESLLRQVPGVKIGRVANGTVVWE